MLSIPANTRLFLCKTPVNMRKSFDGLSDLVEELFPKQLLTGAFFIFLNRKRDQMKVVCWDGDGLVIWSKRLEKGSFPRRHEDHLQRRDFFMLLEGVVPYRKTPRFSL